MAERQRSTQDWGRRKLSDHQKRVRWLAFWVGVAMVLLVAGLILLIYWLNSPGNWLG